MILSLLIAPDPRLRLKALPVQTINQEIIDLIDNLFETMYAFQGCGLAATQVNIQKRVLVMDLGYDWENENTKTPRAFINPEILSRSEEHQNLSEGCVSFPNVYEPVKRAETVTFRYLDPKGVSQTVTAHGLLAVCIQHETEHLDGILFTDHLSRVRRERVLRRLKKHPPIL